MSFERNQVVHSFKDKLLEEQYFNESWDVYFSGTYLVCPVTLEIEKEGIDRIFISRSTDHIWSVEYKNDLRALETKNAFIEIISHDWKHVPGWIYTSRADLILYCLPQTGRVYVLDAERMRAKLPQWKERFMTRFSQNQTYKSVGILVPLIELATVADKIIETGMAVKPS